MTVERLTQKIKLGDKHMIQDSMRRLITMISENKKAQEEIIKFLPENEILKIMSYLEDHDPMFRKLTAKFLLELVYSNYSVQQVFCNVLGILPCDGKVCINQIPESFRRTNKGFPDCIEVLKRTFVEELRESLPYCWYFTPENADQADSQVRFISQDEKKELENSDLFVDPLYAMVGFVVRTPKAKRLSGKSPEAVDKYIPSYIDFEPKKNYNPKVNNKTMNPVNNSLNQSINARSRTNSTSIEKSVFKSVSPVRNLTPGIVTVSSTVGYPKKSKFKTEPTGSFSICNSERLTQNKVPIVTEMSEESNRESIHLGTHYLPGFKRYMEIKDKTSPHRESTLSTDTYDYTQNIKLNDSHLETSVSNSISHKGSFAIGLNERSPNIAHYKAVIANNEKKGEALKKNVEKPEKAAKHIKSKPSELDQKAAFKSLRDNNSFSFSASTTPKNNLLSKILKDKPAANKQAKTKTDQNKKLNSTSTSMTAKHVSQKSSIGGQKNKLLNKTENEYANKKYGFHPSLMKSIDLNDRSHGIILGEDRVESAKENLYQDIGDRPQSCKNNSSKNKTYNLSSVLKSSISTPRTPTESLKASLGLSAKILNSRKSQDVTYQASIPRDKRKSEAFASFQKIKTKQFDIQEIA